MISSQSGRHYLYNVDEVDENKPSIKYGDPIMVTSGAPTIELTNFDIEFNLFCGVFRGCINKKWENPRHDKVSIRKEIINSEDGLDSIRVEYGLFANATVANVEVNLLGDSGSPYVDGFVVARNSRLGRPTHASILFWKNSDNKIQVKDGVVPLSKSRVGVPLNSKFYVVIILKCDDVEYTTQLTFLPQEAGTIQENTSDDKFQVRVTWGV
ncbi:hypothetical protein POM88_006287 [Heracleum sosnowskyi]|uniref:DUF6598 domain-containing protein n=1 Tax=Heracleum sosnowskyi TaxID=360622 RepID=A0AAD8N4M3_9APIA|nr:hypothetical protein POM88_006287 [Heracleum sosnowskyi]